MVRRRRTRKHRGGKRGYKKCIVAKMKRTKFTTPRSASRAFRAAKKKCRKLAHKGRVTHRRRTRKRRKRSRKRRSRR